MHICCTDMQRMGVFRLPKLFMVSGYTVYFWSRENDEPIHVHLPKRQLKLVLAWAEIHKDELMQNWELSKDNKPLNRINPLI